MNQKLPAVTNFLARAPSVVLNSYAILFAFSTYFCMFAFRKPFAAATYEGIYFFGTQIELKTALVICQILGYALAKFLGIKFCSEMPRHRRATVLCLLILVAEASLVLFAVLPPQMKFLAIFLNGLPLGMVWGLVVWYLEGRRASEMLLAGLSCSFILASGAVKDVGRSLLAGDSLRLLFVELPNPFAQVTEFWMPCVAGSLFLLPFLFSIWMLDYLPEPTIEDQNERSLRQTMDAAQRAAFFKRFMPGMLLLLLTYLFVTAFRDFRDNYMVEVYGLLDYPYQQNKDIISRSETLVALGVVCSLGLLYRLRDNQYGLIGVFTIMIFGSVLIGVSTLLLQMQLLNGYWWMTLIGLGSYLVYVPFGSVLFDRLIASTRTLGTAVFAIYVADTVGYVGSISVQVFRDLMTAGMSRLDFICYFSYFLSLGSSLALILACAYFVIKEKSTLPISSSKEK